MCAYAEVRVWRGQDRERGRRERIFVQGQRDRSDRVLGSCRIVSCCVMLSVCSAVCGVALSTIFPRPLPASPESSLSLALESHLGPDNSIINALGWPRRAIPLSADQVAAWTRVTAARLVRTPQALVVASKKKKRHTTTHRTRDQTRPDPGHTDETRQATHYGGTDCQDHQGPPARPGLCLCL